MFNKVKYIAGQIGVVKMKSDANIILHILQFRALL